MKKLFVKLCIVLAVTISMLAVLETVSFLFVRMLPVLSGIINERSIRNIRSDGRINSPAYSDKEYAKRIFDDINRIRFRSYNPYTIWKNEQVAGATLNTDSEGVRKTCNHVAGKVIKKAAVKRVFFFGGGHILGIGGGDCNTIPSLTSQLLNRCDGHNSYEITNYGTGGYNSTQNLIRLIMELQKGRVPDFVIFLDGQNDINAGAYDPGMPGYNVFYRDIATRYDNDGLYLLIKSSYMYRVSGMLHEVFFKRHDPSLKIPEEKISRSLFLYRENLRMLKSLSTSYGFKYYAFWQPLLSTTGKDKTGYERMRYNNLGVTRGIHAAALKKIRQTDFSGLNFFNIADAFDSHKEDMFIDGDHLSEAGNAEVAREIFRVLAADITCAVADGGQDLRGVKQ